MAQHLSARPEEVRRKQCLESADKEEKRVSRQELQERSFGVGEPGKEMSSFPPSAAPLKWNHLATPSERGGQGSQGIRLKVALKGDRKSVV